MDSKQHHDLHLLAEALACSIDEPSASHRSGQSIERHLAVVAARYGVVRHVVAHSRGLGRGVGIVVMLAGTDDAVVVQGAANAGLSPRETVVAVRITHGERNAEIATALGISVNTVRHHVERILTKLQVKSRQHLARRLLRAAMQPGSRRA